MLFKKITKVGAAFTIALTMPAMAADSGDVIALGYANAAYWQAKTCKLDKLSLELNQTCPLMAVATPMALKLKNPNPVLPFSMKCPQGENGTLELISKSKTGNHFMRIRSNYKAGRATSVSSSLSMSGEPFLESTINLTDKNLESDIRSLAEMLVGQGDLLRQKVCLVVNEKRH